MKNIIVIGAGFAGLSAAKKLKNLKGKFDIIIIDKKETFDFLPVLPDCIGRGINPDFLTYNIESLGKDSGFRFIREEVVRLDLEKRQVFGSSLNLEYEYLVIATGSETNFYGNNNIEENSLKIDDVKDIKRLVDALREGRKSYIISGGGYTGVEVATNSRLFLDKNKKSGRIIIIERSPSILGPLPQWMKDYVGSNLKRLNIEVFTNSAINRIDGHRVYLSGENIFDDAYVIWAAGVRTADFIQNLASEKNPQGRLKVDASLRLNDRVFVCGDAAYFSYKNNYLRMAVQFAIAQGAHSAQNIIRSIKGLPLNEYRPVDLGYIIPMANNISCGSIFGFNLRGFIPTVCHFIMCIYRSCGLRNKAGIVGNLLRRGRR